MLSEASRSREVVKPADATCRPDTRRLRQDRSSSGVGGLGNTDLI